MMQNVRGGSGKIMGRLALAGEAPGVGVARLLLRGRAPTPATAPGCVCARNKDKLRRVRAVIMVVRMQAREERKREYHGRAVIDLHLRLRRSSRKLRGKWGFEGGAPPSWRCTGCVGSAGEGNGGVWRHGCGGGFLLPNVGVPWTGCTRGDGGGRARHWRWYCAVTEWGCSAGAQRERVVACGSGVSSGRTASMAWQRSAMDRWRRCRAPEVVWACLRG